MDAMEAIKATFFQECDEQLSELEAGLLEMNDGAAHGEVIDAVFRSVHSIKGGAGAFSLEDLVKFAHTFETVLDRIRNGTLQATPDIVGELLRAADVLSDLVTAARDGGDSGQAWLQVLGTLDAIAASEVPVAGTAAPEGDEAGPPAADDDLDFAPIPIDFDFGGAAHADAHTPADAGFEVTFKPHPRLYANANDPVLILRELRALGDCEIECDAGGMPPLDDLDVGASHLSWRARLTTSASETEVAEVFEFVDGDCDLTIEPFGTGNPTADGATPDASASITEEPGPAAIDSEIIGPPRAPASDVPPCASNDAPPPAAPEPRDAEPAASAGQRETMSAAAATIRVNLERVDRLIDLVGELVINQAMLSQRVFDAGIAGSSAVALGLEDLDQLTREIQDSVMAIRAQPVKSLFQRMSRIIREASQATGKRVRLKTDGESTEIDKTMIEKLVDPLTHMIRNAVDHGLEMPDARVEAGKDREGVVHLLAAHRSGRVVIEIRDDGAGIDRKRVHQIAVDKGLIPEDVTLSDGEIDNLLFMPGFSTASSVSNLSGRGVGMDVVRRSIQSLGGRISISSNPGEGTTISMSLPLTLAVLDGMVVSAGEQTLVVPLTAIIETLRPEPEDVKSMGGHNRVMAVRGQFVPLIDIGYEFGFRAAPLDPSSGVALLVETEGGMRIALLAETIQDQRQVVIKSLEGNYGQIEGVAAATILGDGRVALIIDVDALVYTRGGRKDGIERLADVA